MAASSESSSSSSSSSSISGKSDVTYRSFDNGPTYYEKYDVASRIHDWVRDSLKYHNARQEERPMSSQNVPLAYGGVVVPSLPLLGASNDLPTATMTMTKPLDDGPADALNAPTETLPLASSAETMVNITDPLSQLNSMNLSTANLCISSTDPPAEGKPMISPSPKPPVAFDWADPLCCPWEKM